MGGNGGGGILGSLKMALTSDTGMVVGAGVGGGVLGGGIGYGAAQYFGDPNHPGYDFAGQHLTQAQAWAAGGAMFGALAGSGGMAFFNHMSNHTDRNYVILVDKSASMGGQRWQEARACVLGVAPEICKFDKDGITVIMYADQYQRHQNVTTPQQVTQIFDSAHPGGGSDLGGALQGAFGELFNSDRRKGMTVLVITAGQPNNINFSVDVLRDAANRIAKDEELSVSFIQIGDDAQATSYLKWLDNDLKARFDIVDTMKDEDLKKMGASAAVKQSLSS